MLIGFIVVVLLIAAISYGVKSGAIGGDAKKAEASLTLDLSEAKAVVVADATKVESVVVTDTSKVETEVKTTL